MWVFGALSLQETALRFSPDRRFDILSAYFPARAEIEGMQLSQLSGSEHPTAPLSQQRKVPGQQHVGPFSVLMSCLNTHKDFVSRHNGLIALAADFL